jgi:uncharacterized membrane protein
MVGLFGESRLTARVRADTFLGVSRFASLPRFALLLTALILSGTASEADASFSVCNRTAAAAAVAIGYFDGAHWDSAGWWKIAPRACSELIHAPLVGRYYYLYAEQGIGGAWDGQHTFCVARARFTITGRVDCPGQGYEGRGFFQVDTGNAPDWTENLAD